MVLHRLVIPGQRSIRSVKSAGRSSLIANSPPRHEPGVAGYGKVVTVLLAPSVTTRYEVASAVVVS